MVRCRQDLRNEYRRAADMVAVAHRLSLQIRLLTQARQDRPRMGFRAGIATGYHEDVGFQCTIDSCSNTSLTVLIVLAALYFLGGQTLHQFVLALLVGIAIGTYSSIFNASKSQ